MDRAKKQKMNDDLMITNLLKQVAETGKLWAEGQREQEKDKERTTVYVPQTLHKKVKKYCVDHGTTVSALIVKLLEGVLREEE